MSPIPLVDFHTHRAVCKDDTIEIVSLHPGREREASFFTMGYHPWWTMEVPGQDEMDALRRQYEENPYCLGIGECGLDRLKGPPSGVQDEILYRHIVLANTLGSPLILHCVRAFDRLIRLRREAGETPWVVHGFVRNTTLAGQLMDQGVFLSVAPRIRMQTTFMEMLQYLPLDSIFLETDSDTELSIHERYRIFASLRGMPEDDLREQLFTNVITFFGRKWQHLTGSSDPPF